MHRPVQQTPAMNLVPPFRADFLIPFIDHGKKFPRVLGERLGLVGRIGLIRQSPGNSVFNSRHGPFLFPIRLSTGLGVASRQSILAGS
jgi:hypothetical protein